MAIESAIAESLASAKRLEATVWVRTKALTLKAIMPKARMVPDPFSPFI
jgi:hypothetical protein